MCARPVRGSQVADGRPRERESSADRSEEPVDAPVDESAVDWSSWSNLWQIPAIALSGVVIVLGLIVAMRRAPTNDFDGALNQVEQLIEAADFELAAMQLNEVIEPHLELATPLQRARFEATVADWLALSQRARGVNLAENNRRIAERYARAVELRGVLQPAQLERWADALIELGDLAAARRRLRELEAMTDGSAGGLDIRRRRNGVLRRIVEFSLRQEDLSFDSVMQLINDYRDDPMLAPQDELWAIARQAELRLEDGRPQQAVDHLLVDIRRFEPKLNEDLDAHLGEVYALLARGYYDLGNYAHADFHVQRSLERLSRRDPVRGNALVVLGEIAVANGQWHVAFEHFDEVVRDYAGTRSALPGRLARAEVHSVLGETERSLKDYESLRDVLSRSSPRRDVTPERVARSLADRHDAALTMGRLEAALGYIMLAESFFPPGQVPPDIYFRIASTSRQLADNMIWGALDGGEIPRRRLDEVDPETRHQATEHYRRAADFYVHHARSLAGRPGEDENWADSLWLAADSFDLAGWHNLAIIHFMEYVAGRSEADPRRSNATFRLAQAYHAELDYESAAKFYEQVIADHPRSHFASRSHVPLARCYVALNRRPEAERQLVQVLSGQRHLKPDAVDYRDALIELGSAYYESGKYVPAIERLDEAVRRYPEDQRITEIRFRLADSYRLNAARAVDPLCLHVPRRQRVRAGHVQRGGQALRPGRQPLSQGSLVNDGLDPDRQLLLPARRPQPRPHRSPASSRKARAASGRRLQRARCPARSRRLGAMAGEHARRRDGGSEQLIGVALWHCGIMASWLAGGGWRERRRCRDTSIP